RGSDRRRALRRRLPCGAALAARARRARDAGVVGGVASPAMCRLFALAAGRSVRAAFWLLEAPDSLAVQSRRNPDGYGLAVFGPDGPEVDKEPTAAYADADFTREARERESRTFVAHVRYASTGAGTLVNTHPFAQEGRVFAHNGHIEGLESLDAHLGERLALV